MVSRVPTQAELEAVAARLGESLLARGVWLATAESCTGGWVAQCLTAVAGSSGWFDRGFVTYSSKAKVEQLDVPEAVIEVFGAVSEETAQAMAQGTLAHSQADWGLSITGIAGPTGGSPEKPVGTVCFGWASRIGVAHAETCHFCGTRAEVRAQAVLHALGQILSFLAHPVPQK